MSLLLSPLEAFVTRLDLMSPLSAADRTTLLGVPGDIIQAPANVDIVSPGADVAHTYLVVEGVVGRFAQFSDGQRQITALHIAGDMADVHSVATPSAASPMQALTTTTLIRIPIAAMRSAAHSPAVAQAFWAYSAVDAAILARWAANLGRRTATQRMAHWLCEMGVRLENSGRGSRSNFTLDITQAQLGDALGLTPVHVNRTLKALRTAKLLTISGRRFELHDRDALVSLGDFDPGYLQVIAPILRAA